MYDAYYIIAIQMLKNNSPYFIYSLVHYNHAGKKLRNCFNLTYNFRKTYRIFICPIGNYLLPGIIIFQIDNEF